jgi:hypothetical protein
MKRLLIWWLVVCALCAVSCKKDDAWLADWPQKDVIRARAYDESVSSGPLRLKAIEYDWWNREFCQPYYGCIIEEVHFDGTVTSRDSIPNLLYYTDFNDSCEWTGLYLGSQSMRYYVTGDGEVKANAIRIIKALSRNLHITGKRGFIARFATSQDSVIYQGDEWCDAPEQDRCHHIEEGEFAGDWWWGETSRDMYSGWFFGMSIAYDLIDDDEMRDIIRADVFEVLDEFISNGWQIIDEAGERSTMAPDILPDFRVSWLVIGYHITGNAKIKAELQKWLLDARRPVFKTMTFNKFNRYNEYFGNCLAHELWFNLLRLGKAYFSKDDYAFFSGMFENNAHSFTRLSHNPFFNGVFMTEGAYEPLPDDPYRRQLIEDLDGFRPAPLTFFYQPARDESTYEIDPMSVFLSNAAKSCSLIGMLLSEAKPQALKAFPIDKQCCSPLFEVNPFEIGACGYDDPKLLLAGADFLIAYWMGAYNMSITKDM